MASQEAQRGSTAATPDAPAAPEDAALLGQWRARWSEHPNAMMWHAKTMLRRVEGGVHDSGGAAAAAVATGGDQLLHPFLAFRANLGVAAEVALLFRTLCVHGTIDAFAFDPSSAVALVCFASREVTTRVELVYAALQPRQCAPGDGLRLRRAALQIKGTALGPLISPAGGVMAVVDLFSVFGPVIVSVIDRSFHLRVEFVATDAELAERDAAACLEALQVPLARLWSLVLVREIDLDDLHRHPPSQQQ